MAKTVISGTTAYATPDQMVQRWDVRTLGRLLQDQEGAAPLTAAQVLADAKLDEFLKEESGNVEAAALAGERYTVADLQALVGSNGGKMLAGLVCDLVMWRVYDRRPDREQKMPQRCEQAQKKLDRLRAGDLIFPFQETALAGHMEHETVTAAQIQQRRSLVTIARRYRGLRAAEEADGSVAS